MMQMRVTLWTTSTELKFETHFSADSIFNRQVSEQLHLEVEEFDRRLSVGDILVILGPSREIRVFKKDVENEFCKI